MPDRQTRTEAVISAKDRASAVFGQVRKAGDDMSRGLTSSLKGAGAGFGALAGGIDLALNVLTAAVPEIGIPLKIAAGVAKGALMVVSTAINAVVSGLRTIGRAAWAGLGALANAAKAVLRPILDVAEKALGAVIEKLVQLPKFAAIAAAALAAVATAVAVSSVKAAATVETAIVGFTTLLKQGAASAVEFTNAIMQFAATTPFEFEELLGLSRKLLAYGFGKSEIIPFLRDLGDAVGALGGGGEIMSRVIVAFGQIRAKGKLSMEEVRQIAEAGIPVFDILQKKLGLTAAQIGNLGTQGISAAKAIPALLEGLRERFGGGMVSQMGTVAGMISNFKDSLFQLRAAIGAALLPMLRVSIPVISALIGGLTKAVGPFVERLMSFATAIMRTEAVRSILFNLGFALASIYAVFLRPAGGDAGNWIMGVVQRIATVVQWLVTNVFNPASLAAIRNWLAGLYGNITQWIGAAWAWLASRAGFLQQWAAWLGSTLRTGLSYVGDVLKWFHDNWSKVWAAILGVADKAGVGFGKFIEWLKGTLPDVIDFMLSLGAAVARAAVGIAALGAGVAAMLTGRVLDITPYANALLAINKGRDEAMGWTDRLRNMPSASQWGGMAQQQIANIGLTPFPSAPQFAPAPQLSLQPMGWQAPGGPQGYAAEKRPVVVNVNGNVYGVEDLKKAIGDGITEAMGTAKYSQPYGYSY